MATIYIDNQPYPINSEQNVLQNVLTLGFNLEYFCWHPALGSVGACRQCAVKEFKDEHDTRGKIVMACMTPAKDGARISMQDPEAVSFRASVAEGLMLNHPHDCPVCDEGGECHLQDMTLMTGHTIRRYSYTKRTYRNQYLGPFLNHEMNRCIQCYRCVRFYRDYAGGRDLHAFHLRNTVYFGRAEDGILENEFAGNLAEVCPTGVFTDATLKHHYTRKWDLQTAPSICFHCGVGCNTIPGERYGELRRIINRYNGEVNSYFLCDRGRYGYQFVNSPQRIKEPIRRSEKGSARISRPEATSLLGDLIRRGRVIGIGSPRASLEGNFALRTVVGPEHFFLGVPDSQRRLLLQIQKILQTGPAHTPSLREIECADAVLILGEDVTNTAGRMALSLRQSVRQQTLAAAEKLKIPPWLDGAVRDAVQGMKGPLFIAALSGTPLDDVATDTLRAPADDLARFGFAVAHALDPRAPEVSGLSEDLRRLVDRAAGALREADRPLIVSGMGARSEAVIRAAAQIAWALCRTGQKTELAYTMPECNTFGLGLIGGRPLGEAFRSIQEGTADTVLILENDLYLRAEEREVDAFLSTAPHVVVLDYLEHPTAARAGLAVPAGAFAESDGTLVSSEGRAQRFFQVLPPQNEIQESWRWLRDALTTAGRQEAASWQGLDDVIRAMAIALPALAGSAEAAPPASLRMVGEKIPRESERFSGRTAIFANVTIHEPKPPEDIDSPLAFSMEGYPGPPPPALITLPWAPGWNSHQQAFNKFQSEVGGPLRGGDPGVRLINPAREEDLNYFHEIPPPFKIRADAWLLLPIYHLFGSEELSRYAPAVMERAPKPYLRLRPEDANRFGIGAGDEITVRLADRLFPLQVQIGGEMPEGTAGIPAEVPPFTGIALPAWGRIEQAERGIILRMV